MTTLKSRRVLAAVDVSDESPSGRARLRAVKATASALARVLKTEVDLLYVCDPATIRPMEDIGLQGLEEWRNACLTGIQSLGAKDDRVRPLVKFGAPAEKILEVQKAGRGAELMVLATHGRKGLTRLLLGSVAEEVIRHAKRPVLIIGPSCRKLLRRDELTEKPDILLATDFGKNSRPAETYAVELAKKLKAHLSLIHDPLSGVHSYEKHLASLVNKDGGRRWGAPEFRRLGQGMLERKKEWFRKQGVESGGVLLEGDHDLAGALCREAGKGRALLVLGTHGRSALHSSFFGSVVRRTVLKSPVPVLIVHSV